MSQRNNSGATAVRKNNDLKLCGCSRHNEYSLQETADEYRRPHISSGISNGSRAIEHPRLGIGGAEQVLVFGSEDYVKLEDVGVAGKTPFFASQGYLTDLSGTRLPGSQILAALPVDLSRLSDTLQWPPVQ